MQPVCLFICAYQIRTSKYRTRDEAFHEQMKRTNSRNVDDKLGPFVITLDICFDTQKPPMSYTNALFSTATSPWFWLFATPYFIFKTNAVNTLMLCFSMSLQCRLWPKPRLTFIIHGGCFWNTHGLVFSVHQNPWCTLNEPADLCRCVSR